MEKEELFNVIGDVDERKVAAAGIAMTAGKKSRPAWVKWGAMAACLCLVVVGAFIVNSEKTNLLVVNECDNPKQSVINGVSVIIYGFQGTFTAQFSHGKINYDIETRNITEEELENLLIGIIE